MYGIDPYAVDDVDDHNHLHNERLIANDKTAENGKHFDKNGEAKENDTHGIRSNEAMNDSNDNVILIATNKLKLLRSPVEENKSATVGGIIVNNLHHHNYCNGDANGDACDDEEDDEGVDEDTVTGRLIPDTLVDNDVEDGLMNDDEEYICEYYSDDDNTGNLMTNGDVHDVHGRQEEVTIAPTVIKMALENGGATLHRKKHQMARPSSAYKTVDVIVKCGNEDGDGIIANLIVGWYTLYFLSIFFSCTVLACRML